MVLFAVVGGYAFYVNKLLAERDGTKKGKKVNTFFFLRCSFTPASLGSVFIASFAHTQDSLDAD